MSGKPDAGKLARPVWGWGRGAIPGLHHAEGSVTLSLGSQATAALGRDLAGRHAVNAVITALLPSVRFLSLGIKSGDN